VVRDDGIAISKDAGVRPGASPWRPPSREGVALGRSVLVAEALAAGRLVAQFPQAKLELQWGYGLAYRIIAYIAAWLAAIAANLGLPEAGVACVESFLHGEGTRLKECGARWEDDGRHPSRTRRTLDAEVAGQQRAPKSAIQINCAVA
jgi:hypothetical protein